MSEKVKVTTDGGRTRVMLGDKEIQGITSMSLTHDATGSPELSLTVAAHWFDLLFEGLADVEVERDCRPEVVSDSDPYSLVRPSEVERGD